MSEVRIEIHWSDVIDKWGWDVTCDGASAYGYERTYDEAHDAARDMARRMGVGV